MGDHPTTQRGRNVGRWLCGLGVLGVALVVAGGVVTVNSPAWSYPREEADFYCFEATVADLVPSVLWLIWIALVVVVTGMVALSWPRRRRFRGLWALIIVGPSVALLTFPLWLAVGVAMDCGL